MKNRVVILITVLFSLMLVGIVLIQAWWVSRAEKLNREAFDAAVYRSLQGVVKQAEEKENFSFIKQEYKRDTIIRPRGKFKIYKKHSSKKTVRTKVSNSIHISVNGDSGKQTKTIIRIENDDNGKKTIHNRIIVGAEQVEIPAVPALPDAPEAASLPNEKIEDIEVLVQKMSSTKNPDSISLKPKEIKKLIEGQLKQNNLPDTFIFCLLKKTKNSYCAESTNNKDDWAPYKTNLYPNDIFGREVTLVLLFRTKDTLVHSDVKWVFMLSLFFTIAILILFAYSIRMLIRHKKMLETKNDFINHMSHEFKTPLAGISLGADLLIDKPEKMNAEQINKVAHIIKRQSERLNKEVNDVLLSAQLEENINRAPVPFNLTGALKTQVEMFQLQLENKNAKITTQFHPENIFINGDEMLWQKVFSNLIDNSLKFSKEDPEINISISKTNNTVIIEFNDNGIGIAEKDLPHIFGKFYRSDYYKKSNIQGFGLGLSFVKKVADSHKGIIKATSELGKGTNIIIEING